MNMLTKDFTDAVEAQFGKLNKDVQDALKEARTANGIVFELEQKMARNPGGGDLPMEQKSWGAQFVETVADELKAFSDDHRRPGRLRLELKTTLTTGGSFSNGYPSRFFDEGTAMPRRPLRVRDLIPSVPITTSSYEYAKQTLRTNNATTVAETVAKPESAYGWEVLQGTPKVIAHWIPASRQILDDAPQLMGIIDGELRYGLALKEDAQLLAGDGTGENLRGLITAATAYSAPFTITGQTMLDQVGLAILQATLSDFNPTGIVMHPSDWMRMKLLKDAAGGYLISDPVTGQTGANNNMAPMLHGLPIALTTSIAVDKFLVGDFAVAATLYDRWAPRVEVSTEHADFFTRNMVAILCEERIGLAIKQAGALIYGDFGNVA
jgi:HK97 family phage major capsid protein